MEELIKLYEDGKTLNEISLLTSISISTIYKKLNGCGISFRNKGILPKDIRKDVYDLHLKGMNYKQISKELNVCYDTIKKNNSLVVKHINFVNNKIEEMYRAGKSVSEIHYMFNIGRSVIRRVLRSRGVNLSRNIQISDKVLKYEYLSGMNMTEIAKKYNVPYSSIFYRIKKLGIGRLQSEVMRNPAIDHMFFNEVNEINSYWAGFLAADGSILKIKLTFTLQSSDSDAIYNFANFIGFNNKFYCYKKQFRVAFGSEQMCCDLCKNFNIIEKNLYH